MSIARLVAAGIAALSLTATVSYAQTYEMTLTHALSDKSPYQVALNELKRLLEERSNGDIVVNVQCCGQAGNETRYIQSTRTGVITGGFAGGSSLETIVPEYRVLSLPYLFENSAEAYEILQGEIGEELLSLLDQYGMHGLGFGSIYERSLATKDPVKVEKVEDFAGKKIRVLPTPGFVEAYKALGAQPTPMSFGEVFMALQNGIVDGIEISPDSLVGDRFHEIINNYTLTKTHQSTTILFVSKAWWDNLPNDVQEMIDTAAKEAIALGIQEHARLSDEGLETAKNAGVNIIEIEDFGPYRAKAMESWETILEGAPGGKETLDRIREKLKK